MKTEQLYYIDSYKKDVDATVIALSKKGVILDKTIAYPEGGGQSGDRGLLNEIPFSDTIKECDEIVHITDPSLFSVGDKVHLTLDWTHRYAYMQQHTAQHMLSGLMYTLEGIGTLSVHQGEDILTIETDRSYIDEDTLLFIEDSANRAINENHEVSYLLVSHQEAEKMNLRRTIKVSGDVRLVKIEGVDIIACGGVHVSHTGEVGLINYVSSESIRGHVRTLWRCANRATRARRECERAVKETGAVLSANVTTLKAKAAALIEENKNLAYKLRECERENASYILKNAKVEGVHILTSNLPLSAFQELFEESDRFFITSKASGHLEWLLYADEETFASFKSYFKELSIKGGGRGHLFKGSMLEDRYNEILKIVEDIINE